MAYGLLATPEPLLKARNYVGMIGPWGEHYKEKWYRVKKVRHTVRDWYAGIMPSDTTTLVTIDPLSAAMGLMPRYYTTVYQCRIGLSPDWRCYIRWPTNEYRMGLEEPDRAPDPTEDAVTPWRAFIGFIDSKDSPIAPLVNFDHSSALDDFRFEFFFVRDWMPEFRAYPDYFTVGTNNYVKIILRFLVNMLTLEQVVDPQVRDGLERGNITYKPILHYQELVPEGLGG